MRLWVVVVAGIALAALVLAVRDTRFVLREAQVAIRASRFAFRAERTAHSSQLAAHSSPLSANREPLTAKRVIPVSPTGPYTTIQAALSAAQAGDTIRVSKGVYRGPLVVDKTVNLEGVDWPVIDGGGQGTVVTLAAPGSSLRGFEVRGSGSEPHRDHAGISVTASDVTVENNRLSDVLFGIFVAQAERVTVRGNDITSKAEYDLGRKGDAIRLWYSRDALVEENNVHAARDLVIWYSPGVTVRRNDIRDGRYGVHLMYADGAVVEDNRLQDNSVGIYVMYSDDVGVHANQVRGHHGASGYALGFKDADNVTVGDNLLVDNHAGAFLDGAPFSPQGFARFAGNIFAYNDIGVTMLPAVHNAEFTGNTFWENIEQMAVKGGGSGANLWQGNYWSDYSGIDLDGDGQGDLPYHAERLFESLVDREPLLRALIYSPAAQALEMAGAAFPVVRPQPKLSDLAPAVQPGDLARFPRVQVGSSAWLFATALAVLAGGLGIAALALDDGSRSARTKPPAQDAGV